MHIIPLIPHKENFLLTDQESSLLFSHSTGRYRPLVFMKSLIQNINQIRCGRQHGKYNRILQQRVERRIPDTDQHQRCKQQHHQPVHEGQCRYHHPAHGILYDIHRMFSSQRLFGHFPLNQYLTPHKLSFSPTAENVIVFVPASSFISHRTPLYSLPSMIMWI